jgi:hypothetical protein
LWSLVLSLEGSSLIELATVAWKVKPFAVAQAKRWWNRDVGMRRVLVRLGRRCGACRDGVERGEAVVVRRASSRWMRPAATTKRLSRTAATTIACRRWQHPARNGLLERAESGLVFIA